MIKYILCIFLFVSPVYAQYPTPPISMSMQNYYKYNKSRTFRDYYPNYSPPKRAFNPAMNPYVNRFHYGVYGGDRGFYWYYGIK